MFYSRKLLTPIGKHITLKLPAKPLGLPLPGLPGSSLLSRHFANGCCSCGRAAPHLSLKHPFPEKTGSLPASTLCVQDGVFVCSGSCRKRHELPGFNNRNLFLAALRAGRPQIRVLASLVLGASSFRLADGCLLSVSSRGPRQEVEGRMEGLVPSYRDVNPILRTPPS